MPNAKQRRTLRRAVDRVVTTALGWADGAARVARRFRDSAAFWRLAEKCELAARGDDDDRYGIDADDDWQDEDWDDEDRDEDDDPVGCWESGKFRAGFCPDDLCHGANRCMAKPRPWEGGDESSEEDVNDAR